MHVFPLCQRMFVAPLPWLRDRCTCLSHGLLSYSNSVIYCVAATGGMGGGSAAAGTDALLESSVGWGKLAARLSADIPHQPDGLKAQLRDYQMAVSA